ncbi:Gfo/Idh/MocA family protein [Sinomonas humi]|uniref:Oxidoreductase n=1 Tax=Sinomonas humi TaxID=1338436 RepID=A0A0B2AEY0_9MICC|nr:Gfo/Idh/MocA family oxidoreductase [Sinomonas humi]KHL00343.1 oxidoreductase [Sinomonas humi]
MSEVDQLRVGVVGAGWRGQYFIKLISHFPELMECVGVVSRRDSVRRELAERWQVPVFANIAELLSARSPHFVITSVSWEANPGLVEELVDRGVPVLSETPPAPDLLRLRELWQRVGSSELVQVAEQYALMPTHAARLAAVRQGLIGEISSVQVSSTHLYHAASLIRRYLGVGFELVAVSARRFKGALIDPSNRSGWTHDPVPKQATTTIATLEFDGGRSAVYDFTDNQSRNHLRSRRLLVRGSVGEINDDRVVRLVDAETILKSSIVRHQTGYELDHEGFDTAHLSLDGTALWRNPFLGQRFNDEDIAMSATLLAMAEWVRGEGAPPYPLAEAAQDHLIGLAIEQAADEQRLVTTSQEAWRR